MNLPLFLFFFPTRLIRPGNLLALGLTHIPPRNASISAQPYIHGALWLSSLSHQHAEFAHERPGITLLCHQLTDGPSLHELTRHGLWRECESAGESRERLTCMQMQTLSEKCISHECILTHCVFNETSLFRQHTGLSFFIFPHQSILT